MGINKKIQKILAETEISVHEDMYTIVSIRWDNEDKARDLVKTLSPFSSLTFDPSEISLVAKDREWKRFKGGFERYEEEGPYRLITFDIVLDLAIVGFMAVVSAKLANLGISIFALSTYMKDHILVKDSDSELAVTALRELIEESKRNLF